MIVDGEIFKSYRGLARVNGLELKRFGELHGFEEGLGMWGELGDAVKTPLGSGCYGVYVDGVIAAVVGATQPLPYVWVLGGVYLC